MTLILRAACVLSVLLFVPGLVDVFESPKAAAVRTFGLAAIGLALGSWRVVRAARWQWLDVAVLAWVAAQLLATVFATAPLLSVFGGTQQNEGLLTWLGLAGVYLAARLEARRLGHAPALGMLVVTIALTCLYALAQAARLDPLPWTRTAVYGEGGVLRPFGTLGHPNLLGAVAAAAMSVAMVRALTDARRRGIALVVLAFCGAALVATLSRGAWLGAAAGLGAGVVLVVAAGTRPRATPALLIPLAVLAIALAVALGGDWGAALRGRLAEFVDPSGGTGRTRLEIWRGALDAWRARPWLGHGPDAFELVFPSYQPAAYWHFEWNVLPFHAHSIYLQTLVTSGVIGAAAGLAVIAGLFAAAMRGWSVRESRPEIAASVGLLVSLAVAGVFGAIGVCGALCGALGLATLSALAERSAAEGDEPRSDRGPARPSPASARARTAKRPDRHVPTASPRRQTRERLGLLLAGGLALASLAWAWVGLSAAHQFQRALDWLAAANANREYANEALALAADAARRATRLDPIDDALENLRGRVLFAAASRQDPQDETARTLATEAKQAARRAIQLSPLRALNHFTLSRILFLEVRLGDPAAREAASAALARGLELAPFHGTALIEAARDALSIHDADAARKLIERGLALYPEAATMLTTEAAVWFELGDPERGRESLKRALDANWHGNVAERERVRAVLRSISR